MSTVGFSIQPTRSMRDSQHAGLKEEADMGEGRSQ